MIKLLSKTKSAFIFYGTFIFLLSYLININLTVPLFLLALALYFKFRNYNRSPHNYLNLVLIFLIIFYVSYFVINQRWPVYYIPFCIAPMLAAMLFNDLRIAFLLSIACAVSIAGIYGNNLYLALLFISSGIVSAVLVCGARQRMAVIRAGFIVGLIQALALLLVDGFIIKNSFRYPVFVLNGIACSIIVLGILPLFEYLFGTITNISLLELADFSHPLLQRMTLEAPGTYHHSLVVGNLSEAACRAVGANSLLARIGAYYHDIGKLEKPEYFSENQALIENKHDDLSPSMSKLIIMNHVKDGIELAKKYRLNPQLVDFISQHHGSGLVYYFYRRALENIEEDQDVKEEGFRYAGPKPNTKETAIVLLADSVEAATRALRNPTPPKIEEVVHKVVNNKFIDGQLDECDLTLKDLEKISAVFIRILGGIYHSRVSYPEQETRK